MPENQDQKEFIHWQDLAEQLGADTSREIDDYFGGTTTFVNVELDETDLPDNLPQPVEPAASALEPSTSKPEIEPANETEINMTTEESDVDEAASQDEVAQPQASESDLEIGWNAPTATPSSPPRKKKERPAKSRKRASVEPEPNKKKESQPVPDSNHWDSLASSLGLEATPTDDEVAKEPVAEVDETVNDDEVPVAILVEEPESQEPEIAEKEEVASEASVTPTAAGGFGAGLLDLGPLEKSDEELVQENILGEMFVSSDEEFEDEDEPVAGQDDDAPGEESSFDDEFVEFEVEDLDPGGRRPRGRKKTSRRPEREESASSDDERGERSGRKERSRRSRDEKPQREARSRRSRDENEEGTEDRPRPKKKRRAERTEEATSKERPGKRRRRRRSSESEETVVADNKTDDLDSDRQESREKRGGKSRKKSGAGEKKLPTWNDTINVVVDGNIESRSKKPPRKKRGGRPRRGNQNRDRN